MKKHLWEIDHDYYCSQDQYFGINGKRVNAQYPSWQDFISEFDKCDYDLNLVFRFDWSEDDGDGNSTFKDDIYYRNGELKIFFFAQRKGYHFCTTIHVCRADEGDVIKFLTPRFNHLVNLWSPIGDYNDNGAN